jgi:hypothetical protein
MHHAGMLGTGVTQALEREMEREREAGGLYVWQRWCRCTVNTHQWSSHVRGQLGAHPGAGGHGQALPVNSRTSTDKGNGGGGRGGSHTDSATHNLIDRSKGDTDHEAGYV